MTVPATNLRETDSALDPKNLAQQLVDFPANVLSIGMGGIVAHYPTEVDLHYGSAYLPAGRDTFGEVLREAYGRRRHEGEHMQITEMLGALGGIQSMARELGVSEAQAAAGADALLPAILGGFKKQAQAQPAGLDSLMNVVAGLGGGGLLDEVLAPRPTDVRQGNEVLGQVFGSPDVSRAVAQNASAQTGLDPGLLKRMLPMLAMLVAGYMSRQGGAPSPSAVPSPQTGDLGGLLGGLMGGGQPGGQAGLGGLASMLDLDRDGNPLDDILGRAGGFLR